MIEGILLWIFVFIVGMVVLVKASDYFIGASEVIGKHIRLPPFIIGVTLVAVGTSLPELATSLFALFDGSSEIVVANIIGSNITNILLIMGILAVISKKVNVLHEIIRVDLPLMVGSAFFFAITIWDGVFTLPEAILSIAGLFLYIGYTTHSQEKHVEPKTERKIKENLRGETLDKKSIFIFFISAFAVFLSAKYVIDSVLNLSGLLNIGTEIIAVGAVALGTSLPELSVSLLAVKEGKADLAVGNILGSNIINIFAVAGITGLFGNLIVLPSLLTFALPLMLIATMIFFFIFQDKVITMWEGGLLLIFYAFFVIKLFGWV